MPDNALSVESMRNRNEFYLQLHDLGQIIWRQALKMKWTEPPERPVGVVIMPEAFRGELRAVSASLCLDRTGAPGDHGNGILVKDYDAFAQDVGRVAGPRITRMFLAGINAADDGSGIPCVTLFHSQTFFWTCQSPGTKEF